jgi:hypothetical protein
LAEEKEVSRWGGVESKIEQTEGESFPDCLNPLPPPTHPFTHLRFLNIFTAFQLYCKERGGEIKRM